MASIITIVRRPCLVIKYSFIYGLGSIWIIINTLVELFCAAIFLHVYMFWKTVIWGVAIITLPARALTALQREKLLQARLNEMQEELEDLLWERKGLQERLQVAIRERAMMEVMLTELEEEHDQAIRKIEVLDNEMKGLKNENNRLKEVQVKARWSSTSSGLLDGYGQNLKDVGKVPSESFLVGPNKKIRRNSHQDILIQKDTCEDSDEILLETNPLSRNLYSNKVLGETREIALSRSLFSAVLSLLVGAIVWEAEDPCMPLVLALFTVVGMSLRSVVQFFSTVENKPASDAVALLSFNWFILGTLSYPTLPMLAKMLVPLLTMFLEMTFGWFGFCSLVS